jgi:hypothetical protein
MSDCPLGCEWRYDSTAVPLMAYLGGYRGAPVVWDGALRVASPSDAPNPRQAAAGAHLCFDHSDVPEVTALGPVEAWNPIAEFNQAILSRPLWKLLLGV